MFFIKFMPSLLVDQAIPLIFSLFISLLIDKIYLHCNLIYILTKNLSSIFYKLILFHISQVKWNRLGHKFQPNTTRSVG